MAEFITYSEYLADQRIKYRRKKSYINCHRVCQNGWELFVYYSKYWGHLILFGNEPWVKDRIGYWKSMINSVCGLHKPVISDELLINNHLLGLLNAMRGGTYKSVSASSAHFSITSKSCYRLRIGGDEKEFYVEIDKLDCDISRNEYCLHNADEHNIRVDYVEKAMSFLAIF